MIEFYYSPTPNGWKVGIMLEECGLDYETRLMQLTRGDQLTPEFLAINPNAKMPAILDRDVDGDPVSVFESGAILLYLAEKTGRFLPSEPSLKLELYEWLFWQVGNLGPMGGQYSHFRNYAPKTEDYGLKRYKGEYERCLQVLDTRLEGREFILGEYSIADMISFPWVLIAKAIDCPLDDYPNLSRWRSVMKDRPAVHRAVDLHRNTQNHGQTAETNSILFNQNAGHLKSKTKS
ncbi:MAG: glutathione S-transferase N-terminal domain-containing protein [Pseudomonadota bacterium]